MLKALAVAATLANAPFSAPFPANAQPLAGAHSGDAPATGESTLRQADLRVAKVAYRLALAGRSLCPAAWPLTGLLFHHLAEYEAKDRPTMVARYGLDRGPGVL